MRVRGKQEKKKKPDGQILVATLQLVEGRTPPTVRTGNDPGRTDGEGIINRHLERKAGKVHPGKETITGKIRWPTISGETPKSRRRKRERSCDKGGCCPRRVHDTFQLLFSILGKLWTRGRIWDRWPF